jgi:hypothetical protein
MDPSTWSGGSNMSRKSDVSSCTWSGVEDEPLPLDSDDDEVCMCGGGTTRLHSSPHLLTIFIYFLCIQYMYDYVDNEKVLQQHLYSFSPS